MPLVVLSYPTEALPVADAMAAVEAIAESLARNYAMSGHEEAVLSFARCRLDPVPRAMRSTGGVRDAVPEAAHYEVVVDVPQGGLDADGASRFMAEAAAIVVRTEGSAESRENLERVCCVVREMVDGMWSIGTRTMSRRRIVEEALRRQRSIARRDAG